MRTNACVSASHKHDFPSEVRHIARRELCLWWPCIQERLELIAERHREDVEQTRKRLG